MTAAVQYQDKEKSQDKDPFISQIEQLTNVQIIPEKMTDRLMGYRVPLFQDNNRNHFDDRPEGVLTPIKCLVMHYTVINCRETLAAFTKSSTDNRASATYIISESETEHGIPGGKVIQAVPEEKRAWHAGVSQWRDMVNLNGVSLGIEHVNKGFINTPSGEQSWFSYDADQIHASGLLSQAIMKKYNIPPVNVVAHQDIAPDRKQDPGILFPWEKLYTDYGVGAWLALDEQTMAGIEKYKPQEPLPSEVNLSFLSQYLKRYGYPLEETDSLTPEFRNVLKAFKSHFSQNQNPKGYKDVPDMKDMFWIWGLTAKYRQYL